MSETLPSPQEGRDSEYLDQYPEAVQDVDKAKFMAYAEKPYRDEAHVLRKQGDFTLEQTIGKIQTEGPIIDRSLGGGGKDLTQQRLNGAVEQLDRADVLDKQADHVSDVAAQSYDRNAKQAQ